MPLVARRLDIRLNSKTRAVEVPDLVREEVQDHEDVLRTLERGYSNRAVGTTNMNEHSSRSHWCVRHFCSSNSFSSLLTTLIVFFFVDEL